MAIADLPEQLPLIAYQTADDAPDIEAAPLHRPWMTQTGDGFADRCLPLLIANQQGWFILNNFSFVATWSGGDAVEAVEIEYGSGIAVPMASSHFGYGIITFCIPYLFRSPPGWDLSVRGPSNSPKDGVWPLEGVVETDWASASFTMNWKITRPGTPIHFARGEPICMICPQPRGWIERFDPTIVPVAHDPVTERRHDEWGRSRDEFLARSKCGITDGPQWQRDYMRGRHASGEHAHEHRTRIKLQRFRRTDGHAAQ
jgi:hypothetical protein